MILICPEASRKALFEKGASKLCFQLPARVSLISWETLNISKTELAIFSLSSEPLVFPISMVGTNIDPPTQTGMLELQLDSFFSLSTSYTFAQKTQSLSIPNISWIQFSISTWSQMYSRILSYLDYCSIPNHFWLSPILLNFITRLVINTKLFMSLSYKIPSINLRIEAKLLITVYTVFQIWPLPSILAPLLTLSHFPLHQFFQGAMFLSPLGHCTSVSLTRNLCQLPNSLPHSSTWLSLTTFALF